MHKFWRSGAECLVASLALVSLTVVCYRFHVNVAATALLFMIVVVLVSRAGGFSASIFASIVRGSVLSTTCSSHVLFSS